LKNRPALILLFFVLTSSFYKAQNNTFSPYSRYGLGDMNPTTFSHNAGMGGAYVALKPDSVMPIFINSGNPAAYSLIKLTCLEVGGAFVNSVFKGNNSSLNKWSANFAYGALGFPIRNNGGACFGIMPYSSVGYDLQNSVAESSIGNVKYLYSGNGGLNKVFAGYGIMPFQNKLVKFRTKRLYVADSLRGINRGQYKRRELGNKLLSDLSLGFNVNYIFGNIEQTTRVVYPSSILYNNTYRERSLNIGDFTGNFGLQTAITIDSARNKNTGKKRKLNEKVKITFGYFMALNNSLKANYDAKALNYILDGGGNEIIRDTVMYHVEQNGKITLPLEQGFGIGFKKGERVNIVADFAITNWSQFSFLGDVSQLKDNFRVALGTNFVPEKYAAGSGAFFKKLNYRLGVNYQTGYIDIKNTLVSSYAVTAGVGFPVGFGRLSSMVNISAQYGQMGTTANGLIKENFWKVNFGFTFSDRWFQKFRYD